MRFAVNLTGQARSSGAPNQKYLRFKSEDVTVSKALENLVKDVEVMAAREGLNRVPFCKPSGGGYVWWSDHQVPKSALLNIPGVVPTASESSVAHLVHEEPLPFTVANLVEYSKYALNLDFAVAGWSPVVSLRLG